MLEYEDEKGASYTISWPHPHGGLSYYHYNDTVGNVNEVLRRAIVAAHSAFKEVLNESVKART